MRADGDGVVTTRRRIMRGAVCTLAMALLSSVSAAAQAKPIRVIVARHAEKEAEPAKDPPLTAAGRERAAALWEAVKDANVSAVITTQFARTVQTAEPTATALRLTPEVVTAGGATHVAEVVAAIKRHAGGTVLVVGHSNTVPAVVQALTGKPMATICDGEYDNLYVVTIDAAGKGSVVRSRYGTPSPKDAACGGMK